MAVAIASLCGFAVEEVLFFTQLSSHLMRKLFKNLKYTILFGYSLLFCWLDLVLVTSSLFKLDRQGISVFKSLL